MMHSNTIDGVPVNIVREYAIFDVLPAWLREMIREADDDVHVEPIARSYQAMRKAGASDLLMRYELRKLIRIV